MTKDGRPSLINDIRLFAGDRYSYLEGQHEAVAYGRRIAWYLNGAGFSLGSFPALYVHFAPSIEVGSARITDNHAEWWHRYVEVGVTKEFPDGLDTLEIAMRGIVAALLTVRPEQADTIGRADMVVREQGEHLRFLLKRNETKKLVTEVSFNIKAWPEPSFLFISHTDKATRAYSEADPIALGWYLEGFDLVSGIRLRDAVNIKEVAHRPTLSGVVKRG
ncbi:hypothetical protein [Sphingomonas radiodurans]|uniref:hypothetical protein n=1 Tax=Sphingomonas radiodurans TaxID=2890321 RepID=UPI001E41398A|nr:hypothetical protein [Sphingomonas radiodurans]WBH17199.1 hypothetical protein LLW23_03530 [Sphingomonas radiodurans]